MQKQGMKIATYSTVRRNYCPGCRALVRWLACLCRTDCIEQFKQEDLHIHREREEQAPEQ